jgi:phosphate/sulfate permease
MFSSMSQTQADVELNPEVIDEIVDETGRVWMRWLLIPLVLVAVAGIVFFVIRRFFGNADQ